MGSSDVCLLQVWCLTFCSAWADPWNCLPLGIHNQEALSVSCPSLRFWTSPGLWDLALATCREALNETAQRDKVIFFFLRFYLFIYERHTERGRDIGKGRSRLQAGSLMRDSIPDHGIMTWAKGRLSTTEPPRLVRILHENITKISIKKRK